MLHVDDRGTADQSASQSTSAKQRELGDERGELLEHDRRRETGFASRSSSVPALLLAGDRPRAGADRGDEQEQRHHEREELAAEVAGARGVVELAAEAR